MVEWLAITCFAEKLLRICKVFIPEPYFLFNVYMKSAMTMVQYGCSIVSMLMILNCISPLLASMLDCQGPFPLHGGCGNLNGEHMPLTHAYQDRGYDLLVLETGYFPSFVLDRGSFPCTDVLELEDQLRSLHGCLTSA